jgi:acetylglutamate kinase
MTAAQTLPTGFLAAGINAGIKSTKRDLGVLVSERPALLAACLSQNKARAHAVERTAILLQRGEAVRALCVVSGNANALNGAEGAGDDAAIANALAERLGIGAGAVLTAATGVLGHRLPLSKVLAGIPKALAALEPDPRTFSESILTTDRAAKVAQRELFLGGHRVRLHAVAKGSGMIQPALATTLCFVTTDAAIAQDALRETLREAVEGSFNQLNVDGTSSTNDMVLLLANGAAGNPPLELADKEALGVWRAALSDLLLELARRIAKDGEGASRFVEVVVRSAANGAEARLLARAVAGNMLVKSALFGADPYVFGRVIAVLGGEAGRSGAAFDPARLSVSLQGVPLFERGAPLVLPEHRHGLKHRMREPEIEIGIDLGIGGASARAFGCDLSYDYVKINADYAAATSTAADGSVSVNDRLADLGPSTKKKVLIEALRYIERFFGLRAVVVVEGAAARDPKLEEELAEDILLLRSVGLRPLLVHAAPGRIVAALNRRGSRGVGVSGADGGLLRARRSDSEPLQVDGGLVQRLEAEGYIPVIAPLALGPDGEPRALPIEEVAAELAVALHAAKLIHLFDGPGLIDADQQLISELDADALLRRIETGAASGVALQGALRAIRGGVSRVHLVDGRVGHNLIAELFTDKGVGTLIVRER